MGRGVDSVDSLFVVSLAKILKGKDSPKENFENLAISGAVFARTNITPIKT